MPPFTRRALLGAAALLPLTGCGPSVQQSAPTHPRLTELEKKYGARLGVYAEVIGTSRMLEFRADDRFAFCSTFKALATAALLRAHPLSYLDTRVRFAESDLMKHAPITRSHVDTGMTLRELADAAIRFSDGTAGNVILREIGGPGMLTQYARSLGDDVTRMDHIEPVITAAVPGDPHDTSSPRAFGTSLRKIVAGDALPEDRRAFLRDLLERTETGKDRIRAGVPAGWRVADKTGTGDYGTLNDIAIVWPPDRPPLLISIMSSKPAQDAEYQPALLADAARYVVDRLR
ncbi:class A beta-lactamase [Pseudonocardiaceae bacterium YIM PH 21723]|nr:class A beta-lactamase [Pseudonocardiaceae bacterium YIM PH 21723]